MPGRLRILVLNLRDISSPAAGGAEEHLHQLFRRMAARGHAVTLHCGTYRGARGAEVIDGIRVVRRGNRFTTAAWSILFYLMYLWKAAFSYLRFGYASAMAWILFMIILFSTLVMLYLSKRWVYYEGEGR